MVALRATAVVAVISAVLVATVVSSAAGVAAKPSKSLCKAETATLEVAEEAFLAESARYGSIGELVQGSYITGGPTYHKLSVTGGGAAFTAKPIKGKGCSDSAHSSVPGGITTTTTRPIPAGYHVVNADAAGFRIAVPDSWVPLDPAQVTTDSALRARLKLIVRDPSGVNLTVQLDTTMRVLPSEQATFAQLLAEKDLTDVHVQSVTLARHAALLDYGTGTEPQSDGTTQHLTQYVVIGKAGGLIFTFVTRDHGPSDATVQTIMNSVTLPK